MLRDSICVSIFVGLASIGCGDDGAGSGGAGGDATTTSTTGSNTTTSSTGTTGSGTTTSTTSSTSSTSTASTTTSTTAATTTSGGGSMSCMDLCADMVVLLAQVQGCAYTQMQCEQDCADGLENIPMMCHDEFLAFADCAVATGPADWSCNPNPAYNGTDCDTEMTTFQMCVM